MRQAAYEELWKAEDDIRTLNAELSHKSTKITQLEHASRAKVGDVRKHDSVKVWGRSTLSCGTRAARSRSWSAQAWPR